MHPNPPPNSSSNLLLNMPFNPPDYQYSPHDGQYQRPYNLPYHESNGSNNQLWFGPGYPPYQPPDYQHNPYDQQVTSVHDRLSVQAQTPVGNRPWRGSGLGPQVTQEPSPMPSPVLQSANQPMLQPVPPAIPQPWLPREHLTITRHLTTDDPLLLLILVLAAHDIQIDYHKMVQLSRKVPDKHLWMQTWAQVELALRPSVDIAKRLRIHSQTNAQQELSNAGIVVGIDWNDHKANIQRIQENYWRNLAKLHAIENWQNSPPDILTAIDNGWNYHEANLQRIEKGYWRNLWKFQSIQNWQNSLPDTFSPPSENNKSIERNPSRQIQLANPVDGALIVYSAQQHHAMQSNQNTQAQSTSSWGNDSRINSSPMAWSNLTQRVQSVINKIPNIPELDANKSAQSMESQSCPW